MTLREIASGKVTFDNINELPKLRKEKLQAEAEEQSVDTGEEEE